MTGQPPGAADAGRPDAKPSGGTEASSVRTAKPAEPAPFREPHIKVALARAALAWEVLWPALWPTVAILCVFAVLALFDLLPVLPGWMHLGVLIALFCALGVALYSAARRAAWPSLNSARRRLERDSGLAHRPLTGLLDRQAGGLDDGASIAAWRLHRERLLRAVKRWRVRLPAPGLAARDRYGLRGLLALLVAVGMVSGWGDWGPRLERALTPQITSAMASATPVLDLFVTPPAYTGLAPLYRRAPAADVPPTPETVPAPASVTPTDNPPLMIPEGSTILARVTGGAEPPVLRLGEEETAFAAVGAGGFELSGTIAPADRLSILQDGEVLASWPVEVIADLPPEVAFATPPDATERAALRLEYAASDDYGLESVTAVLRLLPDAPAALDHAPLDLPLTLPGRLPREAQSASYHDLTPHPWAGLAVTATLTATDAAGQTATSEPVEIVLPERVFTHPVARAIIDQRRALMLDPESAPIVSESLYTLSLRPDRFYEDRVVFLALRMAARRLALARDAAAAVEPIQEMLWDTALRIEDGDLSLAERALRDAQQALMDALARDDATDEEIAALMDELRAALDRYMAALQQEMMERLARGEMPQQLPMPPDAQTIDRDQLQEMLDRMQDLAESGARDAARDMLSQLQEMMENLQTGTMAQQQAQAQEQIMEMLDQLQALTEAQRELLDRTFQDAQRRQDGQEGQEGQQGGQQQGSSMPNGRQPGQGAQPGEGQPGGEFAGEAASVQQALRQALGELMRQMGEMTGDIPGQLGSAEQSMRQSEQALGGGQSGQAIQPQTDAVDQLQQGMQDFADQIMEQMAQQGGTQPGGMQQPFNSGRDPLGRPLPNGRTNTENVGIPDEADIQRARRILDELRRRSGERQRPPLELDYIDRLLRQF
ncbi:MAG: TIGR02302 family protein [Inquilinaceae bacterium]